MAITRKVTVVGTGYVGLVTGTALAEIGHDVTCFDIDESKIRQLQNSISPIYEQGIEELIKKNLQAERLHFTTSRKKAYSHAEIIYIAVGTPPKPDGKADLQYIEAVAQNIATHMTSPTVIVTKSTVPVGTNDYLKSLITANTKIPIEVVSNPEFLREGSAVYDTFHGDRIVIGADNQAAGDLIEELNEPFGIPIFRTNIRSAEMIKYASNAFLATKISFINEIANLCEKLGANIEEVADGMGKDRRIGRAFLHAGIGYGGSCFPKDTEALVQIAGHLQHEFNLLKAVIEVNQKQQVSLVTKAKEKLGSLKDKRVALLGLAFKPNTDDMREAASILLAQELVLAGATVVAYDPMATANAKLILPETTEYTQTPEAALASSHIAFIVTEWNEITSIPLQTYKDLLQDQIIFDGRNCYSLQEARDAEVDYYSIGRPAVVRQSANFL